MILAKKTNYNAKISDVEKKYFTTFDYNVFMNDILDAKIKQKNYISDVVKNSDLNTRLTTLATKAELKKSKIK